MKKTYSAIAVVALTLAGCGKSDQPTVTTERKPVASPMPTLSKEAPAPASAKATGTVAASGTMAPPPPIDFATVTRTSVGHGPVTSDLEILNHALERYRMTSGDPGAVDKVVTPAIKDLNQLVKAGIIKALPTPPVGKVFAIDPKTGQAVLADKK